MSISEMGLGMKLLIVQVFGPRMMKPRGKWLRTVPQELGFVLIEMKVLMMARLLGATWGFRMWYLIGVELLRWEFLQ